MRRIIIFSVAVLMGSCLSSSADDKFACPTTKSSGVNFEPGGTFAGRGNDLFGDEKLFTVFPGNWQFVQPQEHGYRIPKIVWGSKVFDLSKEVRRSGLTITGRRLDAPSRPLESGGTNTAWIGKDYFITSEFFVPTLGCWEVTGHFHGADLTVVVDLK